MLRTMREKTKIIMIVLAVAFVGWLVFDVGMGVTGQRASPTSRDLGSVNGSAIRYQDWLRAYQELTEEQRARNPGQVLTREDQKALEDAAFDQQVQDRLMQAEFRRRGITVSDDEIRNAARRMPPQEIVADKDFQTNGKFDQQKWERFLASGQQSEGFLLQLEDRYRAELPRLKLLEDVTSDIYVSDAKLWTIYRDQHDSATVRALVIRPEVAVADASVHVTPQDLKAFYDGHQADLKRPARAYLSYIAIIKLPQPVDSAVAMNHARALRDSLLHGLDFAAAATAESADSGSASRGGLLRTFGHGEMAPAFDQAAFRTPAGQISQPVMTPYGIHLIKVEKRTADSVTARHILIPVARTGARLDTLEARADSLDRLAAEQTDPTTLDSVARKMSLGIEHTGPVYEGNGVVLGNFRIPDVGVWAFETKTGELSPVIETSGAFYVFRLDSLFTAGVPPLSEVEPLVQAQVLREKKRQAAEAIARDAEHRLASGQTLDQVSTALHLPIQTIGPFARTSAVALLGQASEAVGVAFRLRVGERSRLLSGDQGFFFLELMRRSRADSAAWEKQRDSQRAAVIRSARQYRVEAFLQSLRRQAKVVDNRAAVLRPAAGGTQ
ncbi:MAG TPA: SurA N-terminal domain-containing protein [Gemmatimonadales bacterium]|nr:SurA N-terminal domain-containing protein [Gemmatimonadales bacterium]